MTWNVEIKDWNGKTVQVDEFHKVNREIADIYVNTDAGIGHKETYKGVLIEICFSCVCYDYDDDGSSCGDKYYLTVGNTTITDNFVYNNSEKALEIAKKVIDNILREIPC